MKKLSLMLLIASLSPSMSYSYGLTEEEQEINKIEVDARRGDENAQYKLGLMKEFGVKVPEDKEEAIYLYKKAADKNIYRATTRLGVLYYERGEYKIAIPHLEKAANKGIPLAIVYLGKNELRKSNIEKAEYYFKKGIELGNSRAYYELGILDAEYKGNYYLGYINTKLSDIKGYKEGSKKANQYKKELSTNQTYSANDRIKRMQAK